MGYVMSEEEADDYNDYQRELAAERAPKIVTSHVCPPIGVRNWDWRATFEGEEDGLKGWGETEQEAIDDLMRLCAEEDDYQDFLREQALENEREIARRRGY